MKSLVKNWQPIVFAALLSAAVVAIYALGLHNGYIFDDERLSDGSIVKNYGSLLPLKLRLLSYGTFNWIHSIVGESIPAQRALNIALHLASCWAIYQLFALLIPRIAYSDDSKDDPGFRRSQRVALQVGILVFGLHPVATYAVGYLIQRSIVMATLFGVLACWAFVRGVLARKFAWHVLAVLFYAIAVLSKEHAFLFAGLALPLYVFVARPSWQRATAMLAAASVLLVVAVAILLSFLPDLIGQTFDANSREFAKQLDKLQPGAQGQIYALSVLNEAALFFYYGALWLLPYVGWMSIDMHPPFPLTLGSMPHVLGALAYLALLVASTLAVARKSDLWGFFGLCLLFPLVLFWTEFATVWVQDPFVLYRSYLWAIPIPALIALVLTGISPGTLYKVAVVIALGLGYSSVERISSMRDAKTVWNDAIEKSGTAIVPNAVGRSRPFYNRGMDRLKRFELELAMGDFQLAEAMGATEGQAQFAMGMTLHALGRPSDALPFYRRAEAAGHERSLLEFHRGESFFVMGSFAEAIISYTHALTSPSERVPQALARAHRADSAMRLEKFADAKADFQELISLNPKEPRYLLGLGLARIGLKDATGALETFNTLMTVKPDALAFYGRALAHNNLGNQAAATQDIARAVELEPKNVAYQQVQERIKKGERLSL